MNFAHGPPATLFLGQLTARDFECPNRLFGQCRQRIARRDEPRALDSCGSIGSGGRLFHEIEIRGQEGAFCDDVLQRELESTRSSAQVERDFFLRFARELPRLTKEFHGQVDSRLIPGELNKILVRSFHPWQALVVLRRNKVTSDPSRSRTLTVAAVARPKAGVHTGMQLELGEGELGLVAETQQVMGREDFDKLAPHVRARLESRTLKGFDFDLVAPMVLGGETLGVLAVSRPNLYSERSKAVVGLIAHMGAIALQHATAYGKMKVSAEIDGLTGLYNKTYVFTALSEKIAECEAEGTELSIVLFDIDNFKNYNDANGHDEGDRLLKEFAQVVSDNVRGTSILGRYGGEEFLLILAGIGGDGAMKAAENVRIKVAEHEFPHREKQPLGILSFSGGVASYPKDEIGIAELIRASDKALYEAKRAGRNQVLRARARRSGNDEEHAPITLELDQVPVDSTEP